jgi:hypothetical protein
VDPWNDGIPGDPDLLDWARKAGYLQWEEHAHDWKWWAKLERFVSNSGGHALRHSATAPPQMNECGTHASGMTGSGHGLRLSPKALKFGAVICSRRRARIAEICRSDPGRGSTSDRTSISIWGGAVAVVRWCGVMW